MLQTLLMSKNQGYSIKLLYNPKKHRLITNINTAFQQKGYDILNKACNIFL